MYKKLVYVFLVLLLSVSVVNVSASTPPYSKVFDTESEMLTSLSEYVAEFPNVDGYFSGDLSQPRDGYHLEEKEIIIPRINDDSYFSEEFSYAESSWGSGVNYIFTSYSKHGESNNVRFITYYHLNKQMISDNLDSALNSTYDEVVYEGKCNEYPCVAYNSYDENGEFVHCIYEIAAGECLVMVYSVEQYNESFVSDIVFDYKDIMLPVYVQNDTECVEELLGDANEDGKMNIKDATIIQKYIANILTLSEHSLELADFNESGDVNIKDATAIQKYIAGINI